MEIRPVEETSERSERRGGIWTSANVAPVVAGALALLAAGLLIGFSVWAQKVVLEESRDASVNVRGRSQTAAPVVVQDLDDLTAPLPVEPNETEPEQTAGPVPEVPLVGQTSPSPSDKPEGNRSADGKDRSETRSGHIGAPHPGTTARPAAREDSQDCQPRRVRGAKSDRRQPPGHCRNGAPEGYLAHAGSGGAPAAVKSHKAQANAPHRGGRSSAASRPERGKGRPSGHSKGSNGPSKASHGRGHGKK